jgi:hypothetical protein
MKRALALLVLTGCLFMAGILAATPLLKLTEALLKRPVLSISVQESVVFAVSVAFVAACTVPAAGLLLWAYSRGRAVASPILAFALALATSIISAAAAVLARLILLARQLRDFTPLPPGTAIRPQALGFLPWGVSGMLLVCGGIAAVLLAARRRMPAPTD